MLLWEEEGRGGLGTRLGQHNGEIKNTSLNTRLFLPIVGSLGMRPKICPIIVTVATAQDGHSL